MIAPYSAPTPVPSFCRGCPASTWARIRPSTSTPIIRRWTLDKVKPDLLTRDSTLMALTAFWIADRPERLASPWTPQQTAAMLVKKHEDQILKTFGIWPFGDTATTTEKTKSGGN